MATDILALTRAVKNKLTSLPPQNFGWRNIIRQVEPQKGWHALVYNPPLDHPDFDCYSACLRLKRQLAEDGFSDVDLSYGTFNVLQELPYHHTLLAVPIDKDLVLIGATPFDLILGIPGVRSLSADEKRKFLDASQLTREMNDDETLPSGRLVIDCSGGELFYPLAFESGILTEVGVKPLDRSFDLTLRASSLVFNANDGWLRRASGLIYNSDLTPALLENDRLPTAALSTINNGQPAEAFQLALEQGWGAFLKLAADLRAAFQIK